MHELARLFAPRSVAVVGASGDPRKLSGRVHRNLPRLGFDGPVHLVNARHRSIDGVPAHRSIADVPGAVDLALVVVPAGEVLGVLEQCAAAGVGFAVVFTSGFAEMDVAGAAVERAIEQLVRTSRMRVVGPNAEGFVNVVDGVVASFSPVAGALSDAPAPETPGAPGVSAGAVVTTGGDGVAVVSQSGGLGFAQLQRGRAVGLGFTHVFTTGNEVDVDVADVVDFLLHDEATRVVLVTCEGLRRPDRLAPLAAAAEAAGKALVVSKLGRSSSGARAALAHTAHAVGRDEAYGAAFSRAGVHRAIDDQDLIDLAMLRSRLGPRRVHRVAVVTVSGGGGVAAADALDAEGLEVPVLSAGLQERLRDHMPAFGSPANPVDLTAQALSAQGVTGALAAVLESPEVDGVVLVASMLNPLLLEREGAAIAELVARSGKPLVVYGYTTPSPTSLALLTEHRLAWYPTATRAARALAALAGRTAPFAHRAVGPRAGRAVGPGGPGGGGAAATGDVHQPVAAVDGLRARGVVVADPAGATGAGPASLPVGAGARASAVELPVVVRAAVDEDFGPLVTVGDDGGMASALAPLDHRSARELLHAAGGACRSALGSDAGDRLADLVVAVGSVVADWATATAPASSELWLDPVLVGAAAGTVVVGGVSVGTPPVPAGSRVVTADPSPTQLHA